MRNEAEELSPEKRIKNFEEVCKGFTEEQAVNEAERCLQCKEPMCVNGCPVGIDIPFFIKKISEKNFESAIEIIKKSSNLPAVCGRVCPQEKLCEKECVLNKKNAPINIGKLERFSSEFDNLKKPTDIVKRKESVAVVGSGPSGLTCAADLAKLGYNITIYEALHKPGGVLSYGIPEFRLPREVVEKEIEYIKKLGVKIQKNMLIGRTLDLSELKKDFDAVYVACGAGLPKFMDINGEHLNGVYSANEYLTRVNLMNAHKKDSHTPIKIGKNVIVIGAGNTAMDAARTARRLGSNVTLIYRRSEPEMLARHEEIVHAKEEGINFMVLTQPVEILGEKEVAEIRCIQMMLASEDESGRRMPVPIEGSEFNIEADQVIFAIGQGCNPLIAKTSKIQHTKTCSVIVNDNMETSSEGIFAGGDIIAGNSTVIEAMRDGKKAAKAIDAFLRKKDFI